MMWARKTRKKGAVLTSPSAGLGLGLAMRVRHVVGVIMVWVVAGGHLLYLLTPPTPEDGNVQQADLLVHLPAVATKVPAHVAGINHVRLLHVLGNDEAAASMQLADIKPPVDGGVLATGQQLRRLADVDADTETYADTDVGSDGASKSVGIDALPLSAGKQTLIKSSSRGRTRILSFSNNGSRGSQEPHLLETRRSSKYNVSIARNDTTRNVDLRQRPILPSYVHVECESVSPPDTRRSSRRKPLSSTWQEVTPGQSYVFSAFYDPRLAVQGGETRAGVLRLIAITDTRVDGAPQFCQLWYRRPNRTYRRNLHQGDYIQIHKRPGHYKQQQQQQQQQRLNASNASAQGEFDLVTVPVMSDIVPETHGLRFAPFLYTCRLPSEEIPASVSLVHRRCDTPRNYVFIHKDAQGYHNRKKNDFTVCVTPLNFNYSNVNQLVEYIEVGRIFGAKKYVFYNHSSGPEVGRYLDQLRVEGVAEVIQWNIPVRVDSWPPSVREVDIHYFGQLAALNDCLYRNMFTAINLVYIDLDEMIVPKKHDSWGQLVKYLQYKSSGGAAAYIFPNVFFRTEWPDDHLIGNPDVHRFRILTLLKTKHERYVYPWGIRSKYICDPLKVEMVGVHNIWRFINDNLTELDVPSDVGLLHHYRSWDRPQDSEWLIDRAMYLYHDVIISRVRERHNTVKRALARAIPRPPYNSKGRGVL